MSIYMMLVSVCSVAMVTGNYEQAYFDILGGSKVVNVLRQFEDVSVNECAAKCMDYAREGFCEMVGYDMSLHTCQITTDNIVETTTESTSVIIKLVNICGLPSAPENGQVEISSDRQIANFSCNNGFSLSKTAILNCVLGTWNGTVPTCITMNGCGNPPGNAKKNFNVAGTNINDEATVTCSGGYTPTTASVKCQPNGQWESASCLVDCGTSLETDYINVAATYPSGTLDGATASVTCTQGYRSESGLSSWTFVCDDGHGRWTTSQDPDCIWELMFRGTAENGYNVTNAFLFGLASDGVTNEEGCMDVYNTSCSLNYRNSKVDQWNGLSIEEVVYELYDSTSSVLVVKFDGAGSSMNSWFSTSAVKSHPWNIADLADTWWDLNGPTDINQGRSFRMTAGYNIDAVDCADHYYTVVFFPPGWTCSYDDFSNYPQFTYSAMMDGSMYETESFETARAMGIWVKYN